MYSSVIPDDNHWVHDAMAQVLMDERIQEIQKMRNRRKAHRPTQYLGDLPCALSNYPITKALTLASGPSAT